jgi:hemin uptake protein HemP
MSDTPSPSGRPGPKGGANSPRIVSTRDLMGDDKVVIIRHGQEDYRLRITAMGKLILTK